MSKVSVTFLRSPIGTKYALAYVAGESAEIDKDIAEDLAKGKYLIVKEEAPKTEPPKKVEKK